MISDLAHVFDPCQLLEHKCDVLGHWRNAVLRPARSRHPGRGTVPAAGKITPMTPVSIAVIGAGQRGAGYARWARRHPDRASVVAVAEPSQVRRGRFAAEHGIAPGNTAADWRELAGRGRLADAVLICTQDRMHAEPA